MEPHGGLPLRTAGAPLNEARAVMIMIHGRGGRAEDILTLVPMLEHEDFAYLAPQAASNTWYPYSFLSPIPQNEPGISSGMQVISDVLDRVAAAGVSPERTILLGFSQGACLAIEFSARHARRYGGVACLSGGLIGPDGTPRDYPGSLDGTPVFLGCSDVDPHIPKERVEHSAEVMRQLGADVTMRLYPGLGHVINEDERQHVRSMMAEVGDS
ncbi:MAG TPA: dienelactone hydrolase family protein [Gemmatimonadaceae bacterium]|nr:dienelactone hydrolase family protein [Gemmatimonadaceae bacterium]